MDGRRFDDIARRLAGVSSRRRVFLGALFGAGGLLAATSDSDAADRICRLGGHRCVRNSQCCSGECRTGSSFRRSMRHTCTCYPLCSNRCSGDDGCGGSCPDTCSGGKVCHPATARCCTPTCAGRCAGDDGCGGSCPDTCVGDDVCNPANDVCCTPQCGGKCGGDDGCGGSCPDNCSGNDVCHPDTDVCCTPNCNGKTCGDDGCGGTCGTPCSAGLICNDQGTACVDVCYGGLRGKRCVLTTAGKMFLNVSNQGSATDNGSVVYCQTDANCSVHGASACSNYSGGNCASFCATKDYAGGDGTVNWNSSGTPKCLAGDVPTSGLPKDARCVSNGNCASNTCGSDGYCS